MRVTIASRHCEFESAPALAPSHEPPDALYDGAERTGYVQSLRLSSSALTDRVCVAVWAGLLSLLDEPDTALQAHALASINQRIDNLWAEVADSIVRMCVLWALFLRAGGRDEAAGSFVDPLTTTLPKATLCHPLRSRRTRARQGCRFLDCY